MVLQLGGAASKVVLQGGASSKVHLLRRFQNSQEVSRVIDARSLRSGLGVSCWPVSHQSPSLIHRGGGGHVAHSQESTLDQTCCENGQSTRRCWIVSGHWSHGTQRGFVSQAMAFEAIGSPATIQICEPKEEFDLAW